MVDSAISPQLVTEKTAAKLIGVTVSMLVAARYRRAPLLAFVRVGKRAIRYRMSDIGDFIDRNTEHPPLQSRDKTTATARAHLDGTSAGMLRQAKEKKMSAT